MVAHIQKQKVKKEEVAEDLFEQNQTKRKTFIENSQPTLSHTHTHTHVIRYSACIKRVYVFGKCVHLYFVKIVCVDGLRVPYIYV